MYHPFHCWETPWWVYHPFHCWRDTLVVYTARFTVGWEGSWGAYTRGSPLGEGDPEAHIQAVLPGWGDPEAHIDLPGMVGSGYIPVYMPSLVPVGGVHPAVHGPSCHQASRCGWRRADIYSSVRDINGARFPPTNRVLSQLRNKGETQGKPPPFGQEYRYRKHCCTRNVRMLRGPHNCHQTPLKARGRPFTPPRGSQDPLVYKGFLH